MPSTKELVKIAVQESGMTFDEIVAGFHDNSAGVIDLDMEYIKPDAEDIQKIEHLDVDVISYGGRVATQYAGDMYGKERLVALRHSNPLAGTESYF